MNLSPSEIDELEQTERGVDLKSFREHSEHIILKTMFNFTCNHTTYVINNKFYFSAEKRKHDIIRQYVLLLLN